MKEEVTDRRILFVEADAELSNEMADFFKKKKNKVYLASSLFRAQEILLHEFIDIVILDLMLPDGNGLNLIQHHSYFPPIIILSDLTSEEDMLNGLFSGAVDYLVKPCSMAILEAHMALRLTPKHLICIELHGLNLNTRKRQVTYRGKMITLTDSEFNILQFLMKNAGIFFRSEEIYEHIWRAPSLKTTTIKRHLSTLRCKLKKVTNENLILTEFGHGYSFLSGGEE